MYKRCPKCAQTKPIKEFYKNRTSADGFTSRCKECILDDSKKRYKENTEKIRKRVNEWQKANPEKHRENSRKWKEANPERARENFRNWAKANLEKNRERKKRWGKANPDKLKKYREDNRESKRESVKAWRKANLERDNAYRKQWKKDNPEKYREIYLKQNRKRSSNPKGNINHRLSNNIRVSLKGGKAGRSWESLVGYTLEDLMKHLEKLFQPGMKWDNMSQWHIDHIIPISAFNYETPEDIDFKKCWALKNLQPLWARDNLKKNAKLEKPFQPSLIFHPLLAEETMGGD